MQRKGISRTLTITVLIIIVLIIIAGIYFLTPLLTGPPTTEKKIAVLFDVGGRGDLSFNDMAWLGAQRASDDFNMEVNYLTPKSLEDMIPLLESLSQNKEYSLLVLVGFLWTTPLNKTADKFPDQKYALIDATTGVIRKNEVDILFREQEIASLIGIIASGIATELGGDTVGAVAGMDIPPLWKFHIGYLFGVKYYEAKTGNKVNFIWQYTGTFTDTQVGYTTGLQLLQQGARVIYGLAGLTHVGMFNAIIDWNKQGNKLAFAFGQDASQEWYAPNYIPVSGAKRVDTAVYKAIEMVIKDQWQGGIITLGLKEEGVDIWDLDGVKWFAEQADNTGQLKGVTPEDVFNTVKNIRDKYIKQEVWNIVNDLSQKIKNGDIVFKTPLSHDTYEEIINQLTQGNLNAALEKGSV